MKSVIDSFLLAALIVFALGLLPALPMFVAHLDSPLVYDNNLLRLDEILTGTRPSFYIGRFFQAHPFLLGVVTWAYCSLEYFLALMLVMAIRYPKNISPSHALIFLVGTALAGGLMYKLCPGVGPRYAFTFPMGEPVSGFGVMPCPPGVPFNATPSLHSAWIFLVFLTFRRLSLAMRIAGGVMVILTIFATMALGEHYLCDLIVALPFALAIYASANCKYKTALIGAVVTISWQICVRFLPMLSFGFVLLLPAALLCGLYLFAEQWCHKLLRLDRPLLLEASTSE